MDNAANHTAIVNASLAARVRRQMRRDPRELLLRQPETIPIHIRFLPEAVNRTNPTVLIALWVRTLGKNPHPPSLKFKSLQLLV
jgi:hypothetical protein